MIAVFKGLVGLTSAACADTRQVHAHRTQTCARSPQPALAASTRHGMRVMMKGGSSRT